MVAHSPDTRKTQDTYRDAWLAINRLIRGDGSWSGREPDAFYLNLGDGRFQEISGAVGLDFPEDGRAFVPLDFDRDGDLDLIVKFRNAPQLRLLRNDSPAQHHSIAFRLRGAQEKGPTGFASSRDAVGARIELETPQGVRVKEITLGSGFLSQPPLTATFGLGTWSGPVRATIFWPSGRKQVLNHLPADHRITVREGDPNWEAAAFEPRNADRTPCPPAEVAQPATRPEGYAFLEPVPTPSLEMQDLHGRPVAREKLEGQPLLVNFWATWCVPCQEEMRLWKQHYTDLQAAGAELVAVSVDAPEEVAQVRQFAQERALPFSVLRMGKEGLERYNLFYRRLFERRTDLQIPTTFLLDAEGRLVKLYRGVVQIEQLLADLRTLKDSPERLARTALPYPGKRFLGGFSRDYYHLGVAFYDHGFLSDAAFYLKIAVTNNPTDAESWENLGVVYGELGQVSQAIDALEHSVEIQPRRASAHFNLGIAYLREQRPARAEQAFARAAELEPSDPEKLLQYASILAVNGKPRAAIPVLEDYLALEPDDARAHNDLGTLLSRTGSLAEALEHFQRATQLDPRFAAAFRNLGIAYLQRRMPFRALEALERATALDPDDAGAHFALADAYLRTGRPAAAERSLRRVLELEPDHPQAGRILRDLREAPGN